MHSLIQDYLNSLNRVPPLPQKRSIPGSTARSVIRHGHQTNLDFQLLLWKRYLKTRAATLPASTSLSNKRVRPRRSVWGVDGETRHVSTKTDSHRRKLTTRWRAGREPAQDRVISRARSPRPARKTASVGVVSHMVRHTRKQINKATNI